MKPKTCLQDLTADDAAILLAQQKIRQAALPERVFAMLLSLEKLSDEVRMVSQLHHSLQTATMALRAGASDEMVLCALCHDIGKTVGQINHAGISAEILRPYVSGEAYMIIKTHEEFQGLYVNKFMGKDPNQRDAYQKESWYEAAVKFTDEWDSRAFDLNYKVKPLVEFQDLLKQFFSEPLKATAKRAG